MTSQIKEKMYPIYYISANWEEGSDDKREKNMSDTYLMCKEDLTQEEIDKKLEEFKETIKSKEGRINPIFSKTSIIFLERETWCLKWFNHYTFDVGQTDEEAIRSFERFVERKRLDLRKRESEGKHPIGSLMGADDRWRWRSDSGFIPCRCEHCKKQGVLRIDH